MKYRTSFKLTLVEKTDNSAKIPSMTVLSEEIRTKLTHCLLRKEITAKDVSETFDLAHCTRFAWMKSMISKIQSGATEPCFRSSSYGGRYEVLDTQAKQEFKQNI